MTNTMFDYQPHKAKPEVDNQTKLRIDFFDNGRLPGKGRTQYGLVIDLDDGMVRYNINFEVQTEQDIANAYRSARITTAGKATIEQMAERWMDDKLQSHTAFMATAKCNTLAGSGTQISLAETKGMTTASAQSSSLIPPLHLGSRYILKGQRSCFKQDGK